VQRAITASLKKTVLSIDYRGTHERVHFVKDARGGA